MTRVATSLLTGTLLLFTCACQAEDPALDVADFDIQHKSQLGPLYGCVADPQPMTDVRCTKCTAEVDGNGNPTGETECTTYWCNTVTDECPISSVSAQNPSYDMDLNWWFEAEDGTLSAPMQEQALAGASHGSGVIVPSTAGAGGAVAFTFQVAEAVTVYPWARVRTSSTGADSFSFRIDHGPLMAWNAQAHAGWTWQELQNAAAVPRTSVALGAGSHTLRIYRGDAGALLDRVLLTASPAFIPVADTYEAETAARVAPMQQGSMLGHPSTTYMWVPNGAGTGGALDIVTPVPVAGHYSIWGRVNAPSSADNSFFVAANLGATATWSTPTTAAGAWTWAQVHDGSDAEPFHFEMHDNFDFVRFSQREDGTRLDKIIVTNDPGFLPVDVGGIVVQPGPALPGSALP